MLKVCFFTVICCIVNGINARNTYKAAVVEFSPDTEIPQSINRINKNTKSYINYMEEAAQRYVDIIVFPEDGLTNWSDITENTVRELSTEIPEASLNSSPCQDSNPNYSKYFADLSCAAASHKIYTIVNLIERQHDNNTNKTNYYNTNVAFDRRGTIIAKYRKINLFNEPVFTRGDELVTFETDFGVTFGMFICFDIMFKYSALDLLTNKSVTDVVYSTAWFSELPFYAALSIQHGYAKSNGINLIASGLNNPSTKNGGSGIYLHNGKIAQAYISGIKATKMIIEDVPKISTVNPLNTCQTVEHQSGRSLKLPGSSQGRLTDINSFHTSQENLVNYTFKSLNTDQDAISETICSGNDFCCSFTITIKRKPKTNLNYIYKLLAYYGTSQISTNSIIGLRNCALVACLSDTNDSCGGRHKEAPRGIVFEKISIKSDFDPRTTHAQPATLTHNLVPVTEYTYCKRESDGKVDVEMVTTNRQDSLLTFGIHGRVFSNDA